MNSLPAANAARRCRPTAAASLAASMTERELQQSLVDAARKLGWLAYHTHRSTRSEPGFPDLVMVRDGRLLIWELKSAAGQLSERQRLWLEEFTRCDGVDARVVCPADYDDCLAALI